MRHEKQGSSIARAARGVVVAVRAGDCQTALDYLSTLKCEIRDASSQKRLAQGHLKTLDRASRAFKTRCLVTHDTRR